MRSSPYCVIGFLAVVLIGAGVGCSKPAPGLAASQQEAMDRVDSIVHKSGGDWDKLSPDDQKYFIDVRGHGREDLARSLLTTMAKHAVGDGPARPLSGGPHR